MRNLGIKLTSPPNVSLSAAHQQLNKISQAGGYLMGFVSPIDLTVTAYFGQCSLERLRQLPANCKKAENA